MANLNKVFLIGNLTRDPELRYTPNGTAVVDFGLAVNRNWKGQDGEKKEETCFLDITAWARQAEVLSQYCKKGSPLFVEGRLQLDTWESQEGQKRSKLRVVVENFQFLGFGGGDSGGGQRNASPRPAPNQNQPAPPEPDDAGFSLGDDDIPF